MAVFGPQLIFTVIMFVLLSKLGKFYSVGRYLLCTKLYRYLSPNSDDIKKSVRKYYQSHASGKGKKQSKLFDIDEKTEEFNIPIGAEVEIACSPVVTEELMYLKHSDDLMGFVDISCTALIIYIVTEAYVIFVQAKDEVNLSVVWCAMALVYGCVTLGTIAYNYLFSDEGVLLYMCAGFSFVLSLLVQLADTKFLDFQLKAAYQSVATHSIQLLHTHLNQTNTTSYAGFDQQYFLSQLKIYSSSDILFTCFIALASSFIGALLFFPSFRLARLHFLCLKHSEESRLMRATYYINFLMPLLVALCWLKTSSSLDFGLANNATLNATEDSVANSASQFIAAVTDSSQPSTQNTTYTAKQFVENLMLAHNLKIYLALALFILRISLYRYYAQSYLNAALDLASDLRTSATRITNTRFMNTISSIYKYYGVVSCQYIVPLFCVLFLSLLLKTLGDLSWCGNSIMCNEFVQSTAAYVATYKSERVSPSLLRQFESNHFNLTLSHNALKEVFSPFVLRSFIGYLTFWTAGIWFTISCVGLIYYQHIDKQY